MLTLKVFKDSEVLRTIDVENNNFILAHNGNGGPIYDKENLMWLKLDDKHIINQRYMPVIKALYEKFDRYLYTLWPDLICCMIDQDWEPSDKANKNSKWKIDIVKANKLFAGVTGYEYILKLRQYWIDQWSEAQLHAAIMSQLLRIDNEKGIIYKYTEDFQSRLVATFGAGYLEPGTVIADLLWDEHPDILYGFVEASGQITMEELERNKVKEKEHGEV